MDVQIIRESGEDSCKDEFLRQSADEVREEGGGEDFGAHLAGVHCDELQQEMREGGDDG